MAITCILSLSGKQAQRLIQPAVHNWFGGTFGFVVLAGSPMDRANSMSPEELETFLQSLSSHTTVIPDDVLQHYLSQAGFKTDDDRVERLIGLAAQKFLSDVSNDALAHARLRQSTMPAPKKSVAKDAKLTLTVDDLERALRDYGVNLCKPPYFADSVSAGAPDPAPSKPSQTTVQPQTKPASK